MVSDFDRIEEEKMLVSSSKWKGSGGGRRRTFDWRDVKDDDDKRQPIHPDNETLCRFGNENHWSKEHKEKRSLRNKNETKQRSSAARTMRWMGRDE